MQADSKFPIVAKTFRGLEDVLRDEVLALGAENVEIGNRMVSFEGTLETLYKANLCCRTAVCVLVPIEKFTARDPEDLYDAVRDIEWDRYMTPDTTFSIDSTVNSADFTHSRYVTYRVKDGIVDYFSDKYGKRPSIRIDGADMEFNVHISDNRVTISLNSSGESLCKRGYKVAQTEAPINEVLAAGIIMKTGWRGDSPFLDPMCGSGTFVIEAALIAANINPGIFRTKYAFEKWKNFNRELFERIYNDDTGERRPPYKIYGGDISQDAVNVARRNIRNARMEEYIELECKPFADWTEAPGEKAGILVMNPPYGERLKPEDLEGLYAEIGNVLKHNFRGWHAWILGYDDKSFAAVGLKPSVKFPILNGALECSLREYVLFDGAYSEFRTRGGSVKNETFKRIVKPAARHLSDREWKAETRKYERKDDRRSRPSDRRERGEVRERGDRKDFRRTRDTDFRDRRDFRSPGGERRERGNSRERGESRDGRERRGFPGKGRFGVRDERKESRVRRDDVKRVSGKRPSLSESSATIISSVPMRSRRTWKKKAEETED